MFTNCNETQKFTTRLLAGLVVAVTIVVGSLVHATAQLQVFA
jgi:hypothetical protein